MLREHRGDLLVEPGGALIEGQDIGGELGNDARGDVLTGQRYPLGLRRGDGPGRNAGIAPPPPPPQPAGQAGLPDAAQPARAGIAGQQHQGAFAGGVVKLPLQGREDAGQYVPQPVDRPHPVGDEAGPVGGQQAEVADQVCLVVDGRQAAADPRGVRDNECVLGSVLPSPVYAPLMAATSRPDA